MVLSFKNTAYFSFQILATFLSFPTVNIDTSLTADLDRQNFRTAKIIDQPLIYINLPFPQIYKKYLTVLFSRHSSLLTLIYRNVYSLTVWSILEGIYILIGLYHKKKVVNLVCIPKLTHPKLEKVTSNNHMQIWALAGFLYMTDYIPTNIFVK